MKEMNMDKLSMFLGFVLAFSASNLFFGAILETKSTLGKVKAVVMLFFKLPTFVVIWKLCCLLYNIQKNMCLKEMKKEESQGVEKPWKKDIDELKRDFNEVKNDQKKGFQELKEHLEKMSNVDRPTRLSHARPDVRPPGSVVNSPRRPSRGEQGRPQRSPSPNRRSVQCTYCGRFGHTEAECYEKRRNAERLRRVNATFFDNFSEADTQTSEIAEQHENRLAESERNMESDTSSISLSAREQSGPSTPQMNKVSKRERLLKTDIKVKGIQIPNCLVDTGSEVNLLPLKVVENHKILYLSSEGAGFDTQVTSFDGSPSAIEGEVTLPLKWGPSEKERDVKFLISSEVAQPIIGWKTIQDFGITIVSSKSELRDEKSGHTMKCASVSRSQAMGSTSKNS